MFTVGEQAVNLLLMVTGAIGWAYLTAEIIDVIVNQNPDETNFKNRMDDLNRYVSFYELKPDVAQRLREYFYETRYTRAAEARRAAEHADEHQRQKEAAEAAKAEAAAKAARRARDASKVADKAAEKALSAEQPAAEAAARGLVSPPPVATAPSAPLPRRAALGKGG